MFDRCDSDATEVLDTGLAEAKRLRHSWLGTEHLLLALTIQRHHLLDTVERLLPTEDRVRAALTAAVDPGPPAPDPELLAALGIDLEEIRSAVRSTFGPEAIDRLAQRHVHQPWQPWRRAHRACTSLLAGNLSVAPRAKQAFQHALDDANQRQRTRIDPTALLAGILQVEDAFANRLLRDLGVDPDDIHTALRHAVPR